jgi:predicted AlkP superfamily phosphohydrolase/phosphomutase
MMCYAACTRFLCALKSHLTILSGSSFIFVPHFGHSVLYSLLDSHGSVWSTSWERLLKRLPRGAEVLMISDHGNQAQRGGGVLALNQLLAEWGFLRFRREPRRGEDALDVIDWEGSAAVALGGYWARVYVLARGEEAVDVRRELRRRLSSLKAPWGYVRNAVFEPAELYRAVRGDAPDLVVYLDSLRVRAAQTVGLSILLLRFRALWTWSLCHFFKHFRRGCSACPLLAPARGGAARRQAGSG